MKLTLLPARIDFIGQIGQQALIKLASGKRSVKFLRVNTGQFCPHARRNHLPCQLPSGLPPQRKYWQQASVSHLFFPVRAHVFEKKVAKRNPFDSGGDSFGTRFSHKKFVLLIRTGPGQLDSPKRQPDCRGLPLDQFATDSVHCNTAGGLVERSQQSGDFILSALTENIQTPSAIFAAAPRKKNALHKRIPRSKQDGQSVLAAVDQPEI